VRKRNLKDEEKVRKFLGPNANRRQRVRIALFNHKQGGKGLVDKVFFERIKKLLRIVVPSYKSREAIYILILTGLLVIRTYMSIWLADVNGQIVKAIVGRSLPEFLKRVSLIL